MIHYQRGRRHYIRNVIHLKGGVTVVGLMVAIPCASVAAILKLLCLQGYLQDLADEDSFVKNTAIWSGLTFLVGFLVVFRTSQAYARFWDGCAATYRMRAEWFDAASALCAFTKYSDESQHKIEKFKLMLVSLFSILHALALAEIEDCNSDEPEDLTALSFPLLDPTAIDAESLCAIKDCDCKPELVFLWIQQFIVENIKTGVLSVPAPILSRAFQEMANGMVAVHDAMKISNIPFPFPYAQTCEHLLLVHWMLSPIVIIGWVRSPWTAFLFCFIQVFFLWCLNRIAIEIENPFGTDANDLDGQDGQDEMNKCLGLLCSPAASRTPSLSRDGLQVLQQLEEANTLSKDDGRYGTRSFTASWSGEECVFQRSSLMDAWTRCIVEEEVGEEQDVTAEAVEQALSSAPSDGTNVSKSGFRKPGQVLLVEKRNSTESAKSLASARSLLSSMTAKSRVAAKSVSFGKHTSQQSEALVAVKFDGNEYLAYERDDGTAVTVTRTCRGRLNGKKSTLAREGRRTTRKSESMGRVTRNEERLSRNSSLDELTNGELTLKEDVKDSPPFRASKLSDTSIGETGLSLEHIRWDDSKASPRCSINSNTYTIINDLVTHQSGTDVCSTPSEGNGCCVGEQFSPLKPQSALSL